MCHLQTAFGSVVVHEIAGSFGYSGYGGTVLGMIVAIETVASPNLKHSLERMKRQSRNCLRKRT
jgi:hypothetical protein